METLTPAAERWLAEHHGVITTARLVALGVPKRRIERLIRSGVLIRVTTGVFTVVGSPCTLEQRATIICAAHPGGFITGPTAGMLGGLRRMPRSAALHLSLRHGVHPAPELGVLVRQTTQLRPADRRTRADGIIVASWPRLAFDLARDLGRVDHLSVVNQMLDRGDLHRDDLARIGARLCHPGRRGTRRFLATMEELGDRPQQSHPEVLLLDALRALGVPVDAQVAIQTEIGPLKVDLGVAEVRWGVELDIHPEHRQLDGHQRDAARRWATNGADWQIEVVTELDVDDVAGLAARLAANYRRRRVRILAATA